MKVDDFEIEIKKIDKQRKIVIVNLIVFKTIDIRGYIVRKSKYSLQNGLFWWISPPSTPNKDGTYFWLIKFLDRNLWKELECKIAEKVEETKAVFEEEISDEDMDRISEATK